MSKNSTIVSNGSLHRMNDKTIIVLSEEYPQFHAALQRRGMNTLAVRCCDLLDSPVASHADMQLLPLDAKTVLLSPYQTELKTQLLQLGLTVLTGPTLEKEYPQDVSYNAVHFGNHYICNCKTVSAVARAFWQKLGYSEIAVRQGYASCSTCVVDERSIITADAGIARAATVAGLSVLQIQPGFIQIPKYDTGFIGGCSGRTNAAVIFTGQLDSHPYGAQMRSFIRSRGLQIVELADGPLMDIGGMIVL